MKLCPCQVLIPAAASSSSLSKLYLSSPREDGWPGADMCRAAAFRSCVPYFTATHATPLPYNSQIKRECYFDSKGPTILSNEAQILFQFETASFSPALCCGPLPPAQSLPLCPPPLCPPPLCHSAPLPLLTALLAHRSLCRLPGLFGWPALHGPDQLESLHPLSCPARMEKLAADARDIRVGKG